MSKLQELINEYCPNGVKWRIFNEVALYIRGITYNTHLQQREKLI